VVTSVYEGWCAKPDSTEIEPAWPGYTVSPDGKTYTFKMKSGVKFHDGLDGQRRPRPTSSGAPASTRLRPTCSPIDSYSVPDPSTFVVNLKQPVSAFLDYMAAPYGPKLVSPTVLKEKAGDDFAQSYLKDHDAGTGPYTITDFQVGTKYVISAFDGYWGGKPAVKSITMNILPDISTQRLKLESGDLQMIMHGLSVADITSFESNSAST
jgi:peptide/nickel transport system substrate-binding protein